MSSAINYDFAFLFKLLALNVLIVFLCDYCAYDALNPAQPCRYNSGDNGLWLRYYWYKDKYGPSDWQQLSVRLQQHQIDDAYFHVLNVKSDGSLASPSLLQARKITDFVHTRGVGSKVVSAASRVRAIAWVYVGAQTDHVNLDNLSVRRRLVQEAKWLTQECGFDGVQWDYEFAVNGNQGLLRLLDETKKALPQDKLLSVATPMWYPFVLWGWSDEYFQEVARRCDQIAVMCYDSYLYSPAAYVWLVKQQAIHLTDDCHEANKRCKLILGLPTYEDVTLAHNRHTESLDNALQGVCAGLERAGSARQSFSGVALFADYTTDDAEWHEFDRLWLRSEER
ncbi:MAG TPA: glycosyl hydrolase family 18 protein [Planktothrix sp.]|jgi:hypothetical protein